MTHLNRRIEELEKDARKKDETLRTLNEELKTLYTCLKELQNRYKSGDDKRQDESVVVVKGDSTNSDTVAAAASKSNVQKETQKEETDGEAVIELDESSEGSVLNESVDAGWETEEAADEEEPRGSDYVNTVLVQNSDNTQLGGSRADSSGDGQR